MDTAQMKKTIKWRRCEVLSNIRWRPSESEVHGEWKEALFQDLKKGQIYRLFDSGTASDPPIEDGSSVSVALSDASPTEPDGNYKVQSLELVGY